MLIWKFGAKFKGPDVQNPQIPPFLLLELSPATEALAIPLTAEAENTTESLLQRGRARHARGDDFGPDPGWEAMTKRRRSLVARSRDSESRFGGRRDARHETDDALHGDSELPRTATPGTRTRRGSRRLNLGVKRRSYEEEAADASG
ncbi:hypothetical protein Bca52824_009275 [Brassica carinata]|uniref:Uncharacterized protein n=1 Tax=Brassica carinata TaxID=52824 RepID=A0A8X8BA21_BRACI|nr:hypothetical protein Bca52824_009275 [Brassica carinata]